MGVCASCVLAEVLETEEKFSSHEPDKPLATIRYLGNYELIEEVARGGMGTVYRARQSTLNRVVAVKIVSNGNFASVETLRRFRSEAEVAASLEHPNIVPIYEIGEQDGLPYYSMALIEGPTLKQKLGGRPMRAREAAQLVATIARAVHFAHQRGVLHRDIKPTNILIDTAGRPHLTDFGLAKLMHADTGLTRSHAVMGTPAFMSPEQAQGMSAQLTTSADVYSLGAILYHCLTGRLAFEGETSVAVIQKVLNSSPQRPSVFVMNLDHDLDVICLKCLEKKPADRYASAAALAEELERWLEGKPIAARPAGAFETFNKLARRHPIPTALCTLLVVTLLVAGALIFKQWRRAEKALQIANQQTIATERQREIANARLYAGDMALTSTALQQGNYRRAMNLLNAYIPEPASKDRRGIEWRYFWSRSYSDSFFHAEGHFGNVRSLSFSTDGKHLASSEDGQRKVRIWNVAERRIVGGFTPAQGFFGDVKFSPDGTKLALAGAPEMRSFPSLSVLWTFKAPGIWRTPVFSPDGRLVVFLHDANGRVFDANLGREIATLPGAGGGIAFSPDGFSLYSASAQAITEWNCKDWSVKRTATNDAPIAAIAISHDGKSLALGGVFANIRVISVSDFKPVASFGSRGSNCGALAFSLNDSEVFSAHAGNVAIRWDAKTGAEIERLRGHRGPVSSLALSPDGKILATGGVDDIFLNRTEALNEKFFERKAFLIETGDLLVTPDEKLFALSTFDGIEVRELAKPEKLAYLVSQRRTDSSSNVVIAFGFPDNQHLVYGRVNLPTNSTEVLTDVDLRTGAETNHSTDLPANFQTIGASSDARLVTAGKSTNLYVWDTQANRTVARISTENPVLNFAYSRDRQLLVVMEEHAYSFWDVARWTQIRRQRLPGSFGGDLSFAHHTNIVAIGSSDGYIRLYNFAGDQLSSIPAHNVSVNSVSFAPDDRTLLSGSAIGVGTFFNLETLRDVGNLSELAYRASFAPNGDVLLLNLTTRSASLARIPSHEQINHRIASRLAIPD